MVVGSRQRELRLLQRHTMKRSFFFSDILVDVVADGAFGVSDAMLVTERFAHVGRVAETAVGSRRKFHLRDSGLQLCCHHELAAISSLGDCAGCGGGFCLAQFRPQKT